MNTREDEEGLVWRRIDEKPTALTPNELDTALYIEPPFDLKAQLGSHTAMLAKLQIDIAEIKGDLQWLLRIVVLVAIILIARWLWSQ